MIDTVQIVKVIWSDGYLDYTDCMYVRVRWLKCSERASRQLLFNY